MTTANILSQLGSPGVSTGFKNRLINGSCLIAQRGNVTLASNSNAYGGCDRWLLTSTGFSTVSAAMSQAGSAGSVASNSGYVQQYFVTTTGSGTLSIQQRIESYNSADLNSNSVTISLSLYQDTGSTLSPTINLYKPTAQDNWASSTFINGVAVSLPTGVRTTFTYTVALGASDASNGLGLVVNFPIGAVTNKYIQIGDVQLEAGTTATNFDFRSIGTELALCQRYFVIGLNAGKDSQVVATRASTTDSYFNLGLPVQLRTTPTLGVPSGYGRIIMYDTSFSLAVPAVSGLALVGSPAGPSQVNIVVTAASSSGSLVYASYDTLSASTDLTLSAEL